MKKIILLIAIVCGSHLASAETIDPKNTEVLGKFFDDTAFMANAKAKLAKTMPYRMSLTGTRLASLASLKNDSVATNDEAEQMAAMQIEQGIRREFPQDPSQQMAYCSDLGEAAAEAYFIFTSRGPEYFLSIFITDRNISTISAEIDDKARNFCESASGDIFGSVSGTDWTDFTVKLIQMIYPLRSEWAKSLLIPRTQTDQHEGCDTGETAVPNKTLGMSFMMGASDILHYNAASFGDGARTIELENGSKKLTIEEYKNNFRYRGWCNWN